MMREKKKKRKSLIFTLNTVSISNINSFFINYFNSRTKSYEVLRADKGIEVVGVDIISDDEPISNENDLFQNLNELKSDEKSFDFRSIILQISNILIISMLFAMIYIIWPSKK